MIQFLFGVIFGAVLVLVVLYIVLFNVFGTTKSVKRSTDQFLPLQLPLELIKFLNLQTNNEKLESEPCYGLSLILHFLFQEHKDTRELRRWIHRRIQLELNDLTTRSAASRVIQDIKIRDLTLGSRIPVVKSIKVEKYKMGSDGDTFEELSFLVDVDYTGGFQISVDTILLLAGYAQLSIKLNSLVGRVRVMFTRKPYPLWAFSFAEMPEIDFKIDSQVQGRQVSYVVPIINQQIRRAIMKKHVWPNYKVRNRPLFPNPLLQPSPQLSSFDHIELNDHGLEVTIIKSTRLNTKLASSDQIEVYCTASLDQRPFIHNAEAGSSHTITVLLTIKPFVGDFGITFTRSVADLGTRAIKIQCVTPDSPAEKFGFKEGDVLLAVNSQAIRNERAVTRLLDGLSTDIVVLVERNLNFYIEDDSEEEIGLNTGDEGFVNIRERTKPKDVQPEITRSVSDINFKEEASYFTPTIPTSTSAIENLSNLKRTPSDTNIQYSETSEDKISLSQSLPIESPLELFHNKDLSSPPKKISDVNKPRPHSFKIPNIEIRKPSIDFRRTMSEGQIGVNNDSADDNNKDSSNESNTSNFKDAVQNFEGTTELSSIDQTPEVDTVDSPQTQAKSRKERIHEKASEMATKFNESAAKLSDYWKNRNKSTTPSIGSSIDVEFATEASESLTGDSPSKSAKNISPSPSFGKENKKKWLSRGRKSPTPSNKSHSLSENVFSPKSTPKIFSLSTNPVRLESDVIWGQSLHFTLDKKDTKYLNITVLGRVPLPKDNASQKSVEEIDCIKPTLLGSVSIYVPQIIADCQLTLSNCHCEVFQLRPPWCNSFNMDSFGEIAKHPGFDPRLCYGDITIRFRHFPNGLPPEAHLKYEKNEDVCENVEIADEATTKNNDVQKNEILEKVVHQWTGITFKHTSPTCSFCLGKIWLKSGSRCKKCNLVCHTKCASKHRNHECIPKEDNDDEKFESLDTSELQQPVTSSTNSSTDTTSLLSSTTNDDNISLLSEQSDTSTTRRRRIANKISSTLKSVGLKRDRNPAQLTNTQSPVSKPSSFVYVKDILEHKFLNELKGSSAIYELYFELDNSYNEEIVNKTKSLGSKIFFEEKNYYVRKRLIDEQLDIIRREIDRTALIRRDMENKTGDDFEVVDKRIQALASLMLHYCAGMQDCDDNMTDTISHQSNQLNLESALPDIKE